MGPIHGPLLSKNKVMLGGWILCESDILVCMYTCEVGGAESVDGTGC